MYTTVGRLSSYISQGVYTFSGPFHPFGGAVDIIVVQQQDGSFKCTPWYVKFGKFQGVLKRREKIVTIAVGDTEANFHMYLDHKGEAFFLGEERNSFSPGSSPEEPLAIEYHNEAARQAAGMGKAQQDSDCKDETTDDDDDDDDNEQTQQNGSHADELRPATALVANTTMVAIEKVAESDSGSILEVYEKTEAAPVSSTALDDSVIEAPIPTEIIEERYLLKTETPTKSSEGDVQIAELENQVRAFGSGSSIEADVSMITEECSTSGISVEQTWSSSEESREALGKDSDLKQQLDNADKRSWGWFWRGGGGSTLSKQASDTKVLLKEKSSPAEFQDTASLTDDEQDGDRKNRSQKPSRSLLGLMFGASGKQAQEKGSLPSSPRNVVELLEDKWTTGTNGKLGSSPPSAKWLGRVQSAPNSNNHHLDARDLSGAEVVLMSVDGHVVVARQDEGGPSDSSSAEDYVSVGLDVDDTTETVACKMRLQSPSKASTFVHQPRLSFHDDTGAVENGASTKKPPVSAEALLAASEAAAMQISLANGMNGYLRRPWQVRTLIPTSAQLASLNLKEGMNKITFTFTTRVLGKQQVDARIYLWNWDAKIVISDVDGTITKSDVLGQVMPLVGRDWTQTGVTRLFSAIKANGYKLMFLSARAISQAYLTRQFLLNLKQDGEQLPDGPVVISPDGLFPSLYREVIRRAPHEFKISCLEDIKALFPAESQPFYAGFGNRDTDEISYLKVGIPNGKIFLINPKGEVIVNNFLDLKSYTSLHKLVNDMFPPVHMAEREDFNSWNFWKMPLPELGDL